MLNSYQAEGTIGRKLETKEDIYINDEKILINAKVRKISSFSSHADCMKLKKWILKMNPQKFLLTMAKKKNLLRFKDVEKEYIDEVIIPESPKTYKGLNLIFNLVYFLKVLQV